MNMCHDPMGTSFLLPQHNPILLNNSSAPDDVFMPDDDLGTMFRANYTLMLGHDSVEMLWANPECSLYPLGLTTPTPHPSEAASQSIASPALFGHSFKAHDRYLSRSAAHDFKDNHDSSSDIDWDNLFLLEFGQN